MIAITGAGGFIGAALCDRLGKARVPCVPVLRASEAVLSPGSWRMDLSSPAHWASLAASTARPDTLVHLAGHIEIALRPDPRGAALPPVPGEQDLGRLLAANLTATALLVDYALQVGVKHVVFASSQTVYGMPQACPLMEDTPCAPLEYYAASKLCAEKILEVAARKGLRVTVLRIPGVYAETRRAGAVYAMCNAAVRDARIVVDVPYPLPIDVIHVQDVVEALVAATRREGPNWACLNIATGEPCSLDLLADAVASLVPGCAVRRGSIPQPVVAMDASAARQALGWAARPRAERLSAMIESIRHAPAAC